MNMQYIAVVINASETCISIKKKKLFYIASCTLL